MNNNGMRIYIRILDVFLYHVLKSSKDFLVFSNAHTLHFIHTIIAIAIQKISGNKLCIYCIQYGIIMASMANKYFLARNK
jgi:hypothetical protein